MTNVTPSPLHWDSDRPSEPPPAAPPDTVTVTLNLPSARAALAGIRTAYHVAQANAREAQEKGREPDHAALLALNAGVVTMQKAIREAGA